MITHEKRYPREHFTKQLQKMCRALDVTPVREVQEYFYGQTHASTLTALQLWVVGSYARGALTCGDLDVVANFTYSYGMLSEKPTQRKFFGSIPGLSLYLGTPEKNTSGASFADAVLVWVNDDSDWQARLESIPDDEAAGRSPRLTDSIPLRPEQMNVQIEQLEAAAQMFKDGLLEWEFVPFDDAMRQPVPDDMKGPAEHELICCSRDFGAKTKALIPPLWRVMQTLEPNGMWMPFSSAMLLCGSTAIHLGRPALQLHLFKQPRFRQLVLVPHLSQRGPNGAWVIRRGTGHSCDGKSVVGYPPPALFSDAAALEPQTH